MNWKMCAAIGLLLLVTGCVPQRNERPVSEKEFGKDWPLTLPSGTLACVLPYWQDVHFIIFISPDGKEYTLEGKSETKGKYLPIYSILKPAPQNPHYKFVDHRVLSEEGFKLCFQ